MNDLEKRRGKVRLPSWVLALIVGVLALGTGLYRIGERDLWLDEATSAYISSHSIVEIVRLLRVGESVAPLHYILLSLLIPAGAGEALFRLPCAVAGAAAAGLSFFLWQWFDRHRYLSFMASAALCFSPLAVFYSQEARPYAMLLLAAVLSHIFFTRMMNRRRWSWVFAYIAASVVGLYLHYFFIFALAPQWLFACGVLLAGRGRRPIVEKGFHLKWLAAAFIILAISAPLMWLVWGGASRGVLTQYQTVPFDRFYFDRVAAAFGAGWEHTADLPAGWHRTRYLFLILAVAGFAGLVRSSPWKALYVGLAIVIPVVFINVALGILGALFTAKYIIYALPFFLFLAVCGIDSIARVTGKIHRSAYRVTATATYLALVAAQCVALGKFYANGTIYDGHGREPWSQVARFIEKREQTGDIIIFWRDYGAIPFRHYYRGSSRLVGLVSMRERLEHIPEKDRQTVAKYHSAGGKKIAEEIFFDPFGNPVEDLKILLPQTDNSDFSLWLILFRVEGLEAAEEKLLATAGAFGKRSVEIGLSGQIRIIRFRVGRESMPGKALKKRVEKKNTVASAYYYIAIIHRAAITKTGRMRDGILYTA